jgi:hypothetical protein
MTVPSILAGEQGPAGSRHDDASHDLCAPLATLRAEVDLTLRRERAPAEYRTALEAIAQDADQLDHAPGSGAEVAMRFPGARNGRNVPEHDRAERHGSVENTAA